MQRRMDALISAMCGSLSEVLTHADSHSRALSDALSRRAIPLESATNAFLQGLDRRVEAAGADLEHLESLAFGTVSVEELLGHCCEALNIVSRHADAIEFRLVSYGYVAPEVEDEVEEEEGRDTGELEVPGNGGFGGSSSVLRSARKRFDDDDDDALFEDSMSLKNFGISDACLATLSSQDIDFSASPKMPDRKPGSVDHQEILEKAEEPTPPQNETDEQDGMIRASKEEYDKLPPYMKSLASWEELHDAVSKLNAYFAGDKAQGRLNQDDVGSIGLGRKGRSYLLILLRLNQLAMETIDGSIFYNLHKNDS
ncbi:uncharacterized protein LOC123452341 [Hordeum vulgare subsp. vulgare]|uniref:Spindle and kinetochore-associated protein 3 n=1 Tax=Hordeum vulgare subsp. vulgare TaxID=112509 RepID=A0A8I6Y5W6_HORVV|nr:uncharacterized protein LOC123452341 [Hordeum vulgare subsp. vulgare]